jgi:hypothetical protein
LEAVVVEPPSAGAPGRFVLSVELRQEEVMGSSQVQLAFDGVDLRCPDGSSAAPESLRVGDEVEFTSVGSSTNPMAPPVISASDLVVDCG